MHLSLPAGALCHETERRRCWRRPGRWGWPVGAHPYGRGASCPGRSPLTSKTGRCVGTRGPEDKPETTIQEDARDGHGGGMCAGGGGGGGLLTSSTTKLSSLLSASLPCEGGEKPGQTLTGVGGGRLQAVPQQFTPPRPLTTLTHRCYGTAAMTAVYFTESTTGRTRRRATPVRRGKAHSHSPS